MKLSDAKPMLRVSAQAWNSYNSWHRVGWGDWCHAILDAFDNFLLLAHSHPDSGMASAATNSGKITQMRNAWDMLLSAFEDYSEDAAYTDEFDDHSEHPKVNQCSPQDVLQSIYPMQ